MAGLGRDKNGEYRRSVIDYDMIDKLSRLQCTEDEIAMVMGCSARTLRRNKKFIRIHNKGLLSGHASLRRLQWVSAEGGKMLKRTMRTDKTGAVITEETFLEPSVTAQIWLGKQYLGQSDKQEVSGTTKVEVKHTYEAKSDFELEAIIAEAESLVRPKRTQETGSPDNP